MLAVSRPKLNAAQTCGIIKRPTYTILSNKYSTYCCNTLAILCSSLGVFMRKVDVAYKHTQCHLPAVQVQDVHAKSHYLRERRPMKLLTFFSHWLHFTLTVSAHSLNDNAIYSYISHYYDILQCT